MSQVKKQVRALYAPILPRKVLATTGRLSESEAPVSNRVGTLFSMV